MAQELVYVAVGSDRFLAQVIAEACVAAGVRVELLTADTSGALPQLAIAQGHRLLVRPGDVERVQAIISRTQRKARR